MPTSKGTEAQGTVISYSDGGSPSAFTAIGRVIGFNGPGGSATPIDVSDLDSMAKEKRMGLPDEGQITMDLNYEPDNATHQAMRTARRNRTRLEFKITYTDTAPNTVDAFFGYVTGFQIQGAVDQVLKGSMTVEIDGPVSSS